MKMSINIVRSFELGVIVAGFALSACAAEAPTTLPQPVLPPLKEIAPSELKIAPTKPEASPKLTEDKARPPVKPAPAESRTPEEAAARAADPKDPSGALIIKVPDKGAKP